MLSRVADAIYWMNRYVERAENVGRFVDVNLNLALDLPEGAEEQWLPLVSTTGDERLFAEIYGEPTRENVMRFLTLDTRYPNSILACLRYARENARQIRDVISSEMWEAVNRAYLFVRDADEGEVFAAPHEFFESVKAFTHQYLGVTYMSMSHNEAWHFGRLGRLLERADKTTRILDVKYFMLLPDPSEVGSAYDEIQWAALLKSASAFEMYRKVYGRIAPAQVIEFLLEDRKFPRSTRYCVIKAERSLHAITGRPLEPSGEPFSLRDLSQVFECEPEELLRELRIERNSSRTADIVRRGLHEYLDGFQDRLNEVGGAIARTFFGLA